MLLVIALSRCALLKKKRQISSDNMLPNPYLHEYWDRVGRLFVHRWLNPRCSSGRRLVELLCASLWKLSHCSDDHPSSIFKGTSHHHMRSKVQGIICCRERLQRRCPEFKWADCACQGRRQSPPRIRDSPAQWDGFYSPPIQQGLTQSFVLCFYYQKQKVFQTSEVKLHRDVL